VEHGRNQIRCATCQTSTPSFARVTVSVMDGGRAKTKRYCLQCSPVGLPDDTQLQRIEEKLDALATTVTSLLNLLVNGEVPESRSMAKRLAVQAGLPMPTFVEKKQGSEAKNVCHSCSLVFDDTTDVCSDCGATLVSIPILVTEFPVDDYAAVAPASSDPAPKQRRRRVTEVDTEFRVRMVAEFMGQLGGASEVDHEVDLALAHKASEKYHDLQTYVRNWLKKAVERHDQLLYQAARAPASTPEQDLERHRAGYEQPRRMVGREDAPDKD